MRSLRDLLFALTLAALALRATEAQSPVTVSGLIDAVSPTALRDHHDLSAGRPHPAGSEADLEMSQAFAERFRSYGAEVEVQDIYPFLAFPERAAVTILGEPPVSLLLQERALDADPDSKHPELGIGWNAYSGSGMATGEVVYANYGRREDFARLAELGISCRGRIVVARYGGNYRGYKWKYAEEAGAVGLVIYTDPRDSGYGRGLQWPEGGFANETSIQRGSILTLPYAGDPLTPGTCATRGAKRIDIEEIALPRIPVQPMGWAAAQKILQRMRGAEAPSDWQGGLPFRYRLTGGPQLKVRVDVKQSRRLAKTQNIVATFAAAATGPASKAPCIVFGSHHDAWTFGAGDPSAGVMTVLEAARVYGEAYRAGWRPEVDLVFALWGCEEYGIIGSTEWVESREGDLKARCLAYVNLDMAAMGLDLRASASPSLRRAIAAAAGRVPDPRGQHANALAAWLARRNTKEGELPRMGSLGGGSDHVAFLARAGVACGAISAGGSRGTSYHSNYDGLTWYRKIVGDDYLSGRMVTQVVISLAWDFATQPHRVLEPEAYGPATRRHLDSLRSIATRRDRLKTPTTLARWEQLVARLGRLDALAALRREQAARQDLGKSKDSLATRRRQALLDHRFDHAWLAPDGLPMRPWYLNLFAAPDEDSGYAAWMLPALRRAVEKGDDKDIEATLARYHEVLGRLESLWDAHRSATTPTEKR